MPGFYNAEELAADWLWESAVSFEKGIDLIERMGRDSHDAVVKNPSLADDLVIEGRELARKMREFSTLVDRAVASRH